MMKRRLVDGLTCAGLLLASSAAMAETKASADIAVRGGYSTNPYGSRVDDTASATLNGIFTPSVITSWPTGALNLRGQINHTEYAQRYSGSTDYTVGGSVNQKISTLTSFRASAGYNSQVRNLLYPILDPGVDQPDNPDDPIIVDPTASANFAQRSRSYFGSAGLDTTLSPRDTLSVFGRASRASFPDSSTARGHTRFGGGLSYMRAIGVDTSVGLSFNAERANYTGGTLGDSTQLSPAVVVSTKLAPRLSLNATAGATFSDTKIPTGSIKRTSFSGSINLCNTGDRSSLCAHASQSVAPTSLGGTSRVTNLSGSYRYELDPKSQIAAQISYSRANSLAGMAVQRTSYGHGNIDYSRKLTQRLSATVSASYGDSFNSALARKGNFYGTVGIRYRLGTL